MAALLSTSPNHPRTESRNNTRIWVIAILIAVVVGALYMGQASETVIVGERVHNKQERLLRVTQENAQLEADLASLLAPDRLEARAKVLLLHIAKPDQVKYLPVEIAITPTPSAGSSPTDGTPGSTAFDIGKWWNDLASRLGWRPSSEPKQY